MKKLLKSINDHLDEFVTQRDDLIMVLCAAETDALPLLTMLEGIEAEHASDFFWTFTDAFVNTKTYVEAIISAFTAKHEGVRLAMAKEGMSPWPPIPAIVNEASTPLSIRLKELAMFSRELLPVPNGGVIVWTFFPLGVEDAIAYANLMSDVTTHEFPFPWCHHLRFILRDDPEDHTVEQILGKSARVQCYAPDLSLEALNKSTEEEAADETLPLNERMSSLLISATNDLAFQRFPLALEKYALLLKYHGSMNNYAMAALSMHGMGQVYERMGEQEKADEAYQAALIPASQGEHPPIQVFLNVILSLADLRMTQQRWNEAEGYWDSAQQLATVARDGSLKVRALGQMGTCQFHQEKLQEAEQSWHSGAIIAAQLQDVELCGDMIEHMRNLYASQSDTRKEQIINEYLEGLGRPVKARNHER